MYTTNEPTYLQRQSVSCQLIDLVGAMLLVETEHDDVGPHVAEPRGVQELAQSSLQRLGNGLVDKRFEVAHPN